MTSKKIEYAYDVTNPVESYIFIYLMCAIGIVIGSTAVCLCWHMCRHHSRRRQTPSELQVQSVAPNLEMQNSRY